MVKIKDKIKQRNWVAKNNFNRPAAHRDRTQYQRRQKHQVNYAKETSNGKE